MAAFAKSMKAKLQHVKQELSKSNKVKKQTEPPNNKQTFASNTPTVPQSIENKRQVERQISFSKHYEADRNGLVQNKGMLINEIDPAYDAGDRKNDMDQLQNVVITNANDIQNSSYSNLQERPTINQNEADLSHSSGSAIALNRDTLRLNGVQISNNPHQKSMCFLYKRAHDSEVKFREEQNYRRSIPVRINDDSREKFKESFVAGLLDNLEQCHKISKEYSLWASTAKGLARTAAVVGASMALTPSDDSTKKKVASTVGTLVGIYSLYEITTEAEQKSRAELLLQIKKHEKGVEDYAENLAACLSYRYMPLISKLTLESAGEFADFFVVSLINYVMFENGDVHSLYNSFEKMIPKLNSKLFSSEASFVFKKRILENKDKLNWTIEGAIRRAPICLPDGSIYIKENNVFSESNEMLQVINANAAIDICTIQMNENNGISSCDEKESFEKRNLSKKKTTFQKLTNSVSNAGESMTSAFHAIGDSIANALPDFSNKSEIGREDKYPFIILDSEAECIKNNYVKIIPGLDLSKWSLDKIEKFDDKRIVEFYSSTLNKAQSTTLVVVRKLMAIFFNKLSKETALKEKFEALKKFCHANTSDILRRYCKNSSLELNEILPLCDGLKFEAFFARLSLMYYAIHLLKNEFLAQSNKIVNSNASEVANFSEEFSMLSMQFNMLLKIYVKIQMKINAYNNECIASYERLQQAQSIVSSTMQEKQKQKSLTFSHAVGTILDVFIVEPIQDGMNMVRHPVQFLNNTCLAVKVFASNPKGILLALCDQAKKDCDEDPFKFYLKSTVTIVSATSGILRMLGKGGITNAVKVLPVIGNSSVMQSVTTTLEAYPRTVNTISGLYFSSSIKRTIEQAAIIQSDGAPERSRLV